MMITGHDTGCQGLRGTVGEFIDVDGLTCQDDGQIGFGISLELGDGVGQRVCGTCHFYLRLEFSGS
jgi:hypothetical protein